MQRLPSGAAPPFLLKHHSRFRADKAPPFSTLFVPGLAVVWSFGPARQLHLTLGSQNAAHKYIVTSLQYCDEEFSIHVSKIVCHGTSHFGFARTQDADQTAPSQHYGHADGPRGGIFMALKNRTCARTLCAALLLL
jgi:hypothetical protein